MVHKLKKYILEILTFVLIIGLLIYSSDPKFFPDSSRYLDGAYDASPLYIYFIQIVLRIFGNINSIVISQTFLLGFAIFYFTNYISKYFKLDNSKKILILLFLFFPIIKFYNYILTETIAYSLSLILVTIIIKLINDFKIKNLFLCSLFITLLLLTRKQFMFLYPFILFIYIGIFFIYRSKKKNILYIFINFIIIFILHNSVLHLHKLNYKHLFSDYLNTGASYYFFIDAIYISSANDANLFENDDSKILFTEIHKKLDGKKVTQKDYNGRGHFGKSFATIRDNALPIIENYALITNTNLWDLQNKLSLKIIFTKFDKYIRLIYKKFYDATWLFVSIPLFIFISSLIVFRKTKSKISLISISISLFALGNHSVIYIFGRVQPRYFIYSDFILLVFLFILVSIFISEKSEES